MTAQLGDGVLAPLPPDEVHLWMVDPEQPGAEQLQRQFERVLSPEEQARGQRYVFQSDRQLYIAAHGLLRTALSRYRPVAPEAWRFTADAYGKPRIESPWAHAELRFSLTHTRGLAAVAVCGNCEVGVDAEAVSRALDWQTIAERYFAPQEVAGLAGLPPAARPRAFFQYWTLKEAFLKACGKGLSLPLDSFWFTLETPDSCQVHFAPQLAERPDLWQFFISRSAADHQLAVAVSHQGRAPRLVACDLAPPPDEPAPGVELR